MYQCIQTRVLCTSICVRRYRTDTYFVHYLSNALKQSCFQITYKNVKNFKSCEFIMKCIQTMIKTAFLFNYLNELLTSSINYCYIKKDNVFYRTFACWQKKFYPLQAYKYDNYIVGPKQITGEHCVYDDHTVTGFAWNDGRSPINHREEILYDRRRNARNKLSY